VAGELGLQADAIRVSVLDAMKQSNRIDWGYEPLNLEIGGVK
jgi:hypothetical protein